MTNLPRKNNGGSSQGKKPNSTHDVIIQGDVHLTPNDIAELRKLTDSHPDLAK